MAATNSALAVLRNATHETHVRLEKNLKVASDQAGSADYIAYIAALWGWMESFEDPLWQADWPTEIGAMQRNGKCRWLRQDLASAGYGEAELAAIPKSRFMPDLSSMPARFGTAYVIEGAQLGTQVLRKMIGPTLEPWTPRWLQGYGGDTALHWRTFVACAEQHLTEEKSQILAAQSARDTFNALASWLRMQDIA